MIKRVKYGCFAFLFITTLTLSSIVAILASGSAGLDNSLYLTYVPQDGFDIITGSEFVKILKEGSGTNNTITSIIFGYNTEENLAKVADAESCTSVALDGSDDVLLYKVANGETYEVYVLSSSKIYFNANSSSMFTSLTALNNIDLQVVDTSKVENMASMFSGCLALEHIDLSSFNTSRVTHMTYMFNGCNALVSLDLRGWDTSNVQYMTYMFYSIKSSSLKTIYTDRDWSTASLVSSLSMFGGCENLVGGNGTTYNQAYTDATYARIDTAETPGYFTLKTL